MKSLNREIPPLPTFFEIPHKERLPKGVCNIYHEIISMKYDSFFSFSFDILVFDDKISLLKYSMKEYFFSGSSVEEEDLFSFSKSISLKAFHKG